VKLPWLRPSAVTALQVSTRASLAAALSVVVARRVDLEFPLYALIAAIIVTDLSPARTRQLSLQRLVGTVIGAAVGALVSMASPATHGGVLTIAIGVLVAMLLSHAFRVTAAAKLAGYVCGIVLLNYNDHPWSYASYRFVETLIGITTAVIVSFIPALISAEDSFEMAANQIQSKR
jgi:uncharacterized membrane protein YgaE (UPF0421/DUF939 family)